MDWRKLKMKLSKIIWFIPLLVGIVDNDCAALQEPNLHDLVEALCKVESNNDPNAIGDLEKDDVAVGVLQIRKIMVDEVNRICQLLKLNYAFEYQDRYNPAMSRRMALIYLAFVKKHFNLDWEQTARCWNGGLYGWQKRCTIGYGKKAIAALKEKAK